VGSADYRRWTSPAGFEEWWDDRTRALAALIPSGARVIEFGAGRRQLEKLLPDGCFYIPSDLVDRGGGTLVCDLNARPLPDIRHLGSDLAVFGGVLEYVSDVESLACWLATIGIRTCVVSFDAVPDKAGPLAWLGERLRRTRFGYMNSLSEDQLLLAFRVVGFTCAEVREWTTQRIYFFVRQS
jgi:hypothetical protein